MRGFDECFDVGPRGRLGCGRRALRRQGCFSRRGCRCGGFCPRLRIGLRVANLRAYGTEVPAALLLGPVEMIVPMASRRRGGVWRRQAFVVNGGRSARENGCRTAGENGDRTARENG